MQQYSVFAFCLPIAGSEKGRTWYTVQCTVATALTIQRQKLTQHFVKEKKDHLQEPPGIPEREKANVVIFLPALL